MEDSKLNIICGTTTIEALFSLQRKYVVNSANQLHFKEYFGEHNIWFKHYFLWLYIYFFDSMQYFCLKSVM